MMKRCLAILMLLCFLPAAGLAEEMDFMKAKAVLMPVPELYYEGIMLYASPLYSVVVSQYNGIYLYNELTGECTDLTLAEGEEDKLPQLELEDNEKKFYQKNVEEKGFLKAWMMHGKARVLDDYRTAGNRMLIKLSGMHLLIDLDTKKIRVADDAIALTDAGELICWTSGQNEYSIIRQDGAAQTIALAQPPLEESRLGTLDASEDGYACVWIDSSGFFMDPAVCYAAIGHGEEAVFAPIGTYKSARYPDSIMLLGEDAALLRNTGGDLQCAPILVRGAEAKALIWNGEAMKGVTLGEISAREAMQQEPGAHVLVAMGVSSDGTCAMLLDMDQGAVLMMDTETLETVIAVDTEAMLDAGLSPYMLSLNWWNGGIRTGSWMNYRLILTEE